MLLAALLVLASARPLLLRAQQSPPGTTPPSIDTTSTTTSAVVTTQTVTMNGQQVGEVMINGNVVMRLAGTTGGYSAGDRAMLVAGRLQSLLAQGYTWNEVRVDTVNHQSVLMLGDQLLVTVNPADAQINRTTTRTLAQSWQSSLQVALRPGATTGTTVGTGTTGGTTVAGSQEQWPDWSNAKTKIVPIVSLGTPGVQIGAAQIKGPGERVDTVRAVLQLDLTFKKAARIRAFVPSTSLTSLHRVQGVAVSALLQYSLFKF
jgi:hypothetical protein